MEVTAVAAGSERLRAKQLSALILNDRVIHGTNVGRHECRILSLPDLQTLHSRCVA